jgi:cyclophilin family peptidyl-prolyl cis-trans isomerase
MYSHNSILNGLIVFGLLFCLMGSTALAQSGSKGSVSKPKISKEPEAKMEKNPVVIMDTSMGTIKIELNQKQAPITVANFLKYVDNKFYDGTIFHRIISTFMIQGGGMTPDMKQKETMAPIKNEAGNGLKNLRGTIAMARTGVVDSATSQFFINVVDNQFLNHKDTSPRGYGYAVFGKVIDGMDVVDKIKAVPTGSKAGHQDVPLTPVLIKSVKRDGK